MCLMQALPLRPVRLLWVLNLRFQSMCGSGCVPQLQIRHFWCVGKNVAANLELPTQETFRPGSYGYAFPFQ